MSDETRLAIDDTETPVNPYSLLAAVNAASRSANVAWLIFLAVMVYLVVTLASVTHRDLLLNGEVTLPLLQTKIGLTRFFVLVAPLLLLLHVGLLGKLALLVRNAIEFDAALRLLESTDERSHPLRLELDNFFLVQAIAGPERSRVLSAFLNGLSWLTLVVFPLALLLYVQLAFLPFHDPVITVIHRLVVLADILVLVFLGVFLMRADASYFGAFWRCAAHNPGSLAFAVVALAAAAFMSAFAALPGEASRDDWTRRLLSADGALLGIFPRNLKVADVDLAGGPEPMPVGRSVNLRGRDLRFARLERADLRRADLTGANLDGANLAGADLRGARLSCEQSLVVRPQEDRSAALCTSGRSANFSKARLGGADMAGADLRGARFEGARLERASLAGAQIAGADFSRAELQAADMSGGAAMQGASFESANLQGADLSGAKLQMTDFSGAAMQGATLSLANLEGASLREAALDGAGLRLAKLFGADLRGARLQLADLSGAFVWQTLPPQAESTASAEVGGVLLTPPSEEDMTRMRSAAQALEAAPDKVRLAGLATSLNDAGSNNTWFGSPDGQAWMNIAAKAREAAAAEGYRARFTEQLVRLACSARYGDGAVAMGIARRAAAVGFNGDVAAMFDRFRGTDCSASAALPLGVLRDLAAAAEVSRGQ